MKTTNSNLTESQKASVEEMLRNDVPIPIIKEKLGLEDADYIYEVKYAKNIKNRVSIATEKYAKVADSQEQDSSYDKVIEGIELYRNKHDRPLKIIELGCGNGSFAQRIAKHFPDCTIDAIELSASGVLYANEHYGDIPNLNCYQTDGYKLWESKGGTFDVVYHVNVLEHVPYKEDYVDASIKLLKDDGVLLFGFPTESYWKFWGLKTGNVFIDKYTLLCIIATHETQ